jgi:hypothetical protein
MSSSSRLPALGCLACPILGVADPAHPAHPGMLNLVPVVPCGTPPPLRLGRRLWQAARGTLGRPVCATRRIPNCRAESRPWGTRSSIPACKELTRSWVTQIRSSRRACILSTKIIPLPTGAASRDGDLRAYPPADSPPISPM